MSIHIKCKNGHAFSIKSGCAGQTFRCPTCRARVMAPMRPTDAEDTILALLGAPDAATTPRPSSPASTSDDDAPVVLKMPRPETKRCPKCRASVRMSYHLCPHCKTYFSDGDEIRRRLAGA